MSEGTDKTWDVVPLPSDDGATTVLPPAREHGEGGVAPPAFPVDGEPGDGDKPGRKRPKWLIPLIAAVVVAVLAAAGTGGWYAWSRHELSVARESCETAVVKAGKAAAAYGKLVKDDTVTAASKTDPNTVKDSSMIDTLSKLTDAKTPVTTSCDADVKADVEAAEAKAVVASDWYATQTKKINAAVTAINDSVLDKAVDDANALYTSSEGKVQDDKTRETLKSAIDKRDAQAIADATKNVNDSITAKEQADKEKAEQEAAEKKAQEEAAAAAEAAAQAQSQTPTYSYGYSSGGYSGYSSGGYSGSGYTNSGSSGGYSSGSSNSGGGTSSGGGASSGSSSGSTQQGPVSGGHGSSDQTKPITPTYER